MKFIVEIHREDLKPKPMHLGNLIHYSWTQGATHKYVVIETYDLPIEPLKRVSCVNNALKQVFDRDLERFVKEYEID